MLIKPLAGRAVRDPVKGTLLPADGAVVTMDVFWTRRLRDGDVEEVTATAAPTTTDSTSTATTDTTEDVS